MRKKHIGRIIVPPGAFMDIHEKLAVDFLAINLGHDITFLVPQRQIGAKTPDIEMNGIQWEIKSPLGKSSRTIENNLRAALKQSPYIVLDLRRMDGRIPTRRLVAEIERRFNDAKSIKSILVITRQDALIDLKR